MIQMRPATFRDGDDLFAWRNDAETLAASRSTAPVPHADHLHWMQYNVGYGYPQHFVMIAEDVDLGRSIGVVRFDARAEDNMAFEVSITMAPQERGKGRAGDVLSRACGYMSEYTIHAQVRRENTTSRKLFERCGFEEIDREDGFLNFRREPVA